MNESIAAVTISILMTTNVIYKYPQIRDVWWRGDGHYLLNWSNTVNAIYIAPPTIDDPNAKERWRITNVLQTTTVKSANWQFVTNQVVWSSSPVREVLVSHWEEVPTNSATRPITSSQYINAFQGITITESSEMPITGGRQ